MRSFSNSRSLYFKVPLYCLKAMYCICKFEACLLFISFIFFSFTMIRAKNSDKGKNVFQNGFKAKEKVYTPFCEQDALLEAFYYIYIKKIKIFLEKDLLETIRMIFTMRTVIVMNEMINLLL